MKVYLVYAVDEDYEGPGTPGLVVVEVHGDEVAARNAVAARPTTSVRIEEWEVGGTEGRVLVDDIDGTPV